MEEMFLKLEQKSKDYFTQENIHYQLVSHAKSDLSNPFHSCESNTRDKLINRFITLRLDISAKEYAREKRLELEEKMARLFLH